MIIQLRVHDMHVHVDIFWFATALLSVNSTYSTYATTRACLHRYVKSHAIVSVS